MFLNHVKKQQQRKTQQIAVVCVRVELTTLALSAPRSADWANGPIAVMQMFK